MSERGSSRSLVEIESTSREFNQLASVINAKVKAFEDWFNTLPGRTAVRVERQDFGGPSYILKMERVKDVWKLAFGTIEGDKFLFFTFDALSMTDKCEAVSMLPDLLKAFHDEQRTAVNRMKAAADIFSQLDSLKGGK